MKAALCSIACVVAMTGSAPLAQRAPVANRADSVVANAGTIAGHVTDARSMPVSDYSVIVFPTDRTKWLANSRFLTVTRPSQDGGFEVGNLAAGEYWVVAVDPMREGQSTGDWEKPEVLGPLTTRATRVTLAARERFMTVLRLTRR
jgi:hypothetical protein